MAFTPLKVTKELKTIPFQVANTIYQDAADLAAETAEAANLQEYNEYISRLEEQYAATHEASYEGNFSEERPYVSVPNLPDIRRKAGQTAIIEDFIPRYKLDTLLQTHVMSQIISWLTHKPIHLEEVYITKSDGSRKINGVKMLEQIFDPKSEWDMGLYRFLMLDSRSCYIKSQYKGDGRLYCALVPLILYAFKMNKGIKYSEWDKDTLKHVVNKSLYDAMTCEVPEGLSRDLLLAIRDEGLVYRSGAKKGEARNALSTFKLYGIQHTEIGHLPELAQTMLTQIWCAHPHNRTKYMVLDPRNWDSIPAPLITTDIFINDNQVPASLRQTPPVKQENMPWLD